MHFIGSGPKSGKPAASVQGYEVEFYAAGEFVERRSYSFSDVDERTMMRRINSWVASGLLYI
jgi:hypothetical protein